MRLWWLRMLIFLGIVIGLSVYVSSLVKILSVEEAYIVDPTDKDIHEISSVSIISNDTNHLIWFLQISDIHISRFGYADRLTDFRQFCNINVKVIRPDLVVATGDLTDGKTPDMLGSTQYEQEWQMYSDTLSDSGVLDITTWLDVRGNHDDFNVHSINSSNNYFRRYSVQGSKRPRSYHHRLRKGVDTYSFIALDACPEPGPRRPFNFIGLLTEKEMRRLEELAAESRGSNSTIWFGHYPTSTILSASPGVRTVISNGLAYLCGHLHTLGGLVSKMYTLQQTGTLELELGDWKDKRMYRLMAIDHGLLTFVDSPFDKWPLILVTNPKPTQFAVPKLEPLHLIASSTHIRVLIFSTAEISESTYRIDGGPWNSLKRVEGSFYVAQWNPALYSQGLHTLEVFAKDVLDQSTTYEMQFSLDGSRVGFPLLPRITLMTNMVAVCQGIFAVFLSLALLPLLAVRLYGSLVLRRKFPPPRRRSTCTYRWSQRLSLVAFVDQLFYPLMLLAVYVAIGPWFVGEVIDGYFGFCFAWGIYVDGHLIPGGITFIYGAMHLLLFNIPLLLILAARANQRYQVLLGEKTTRYGRMSCVTCYLLMVGLQVMQVYGMYLWYGSMSTVLCPLKTWSVVMAVILWIRAGTLPLSSYHIPLKVYPRCQPSPST